MKRKAFLPLRWLVYLLLLTLLATGVSLSRYKTTVAGTGTVSVARPVVEFADNSAVTIEGMQPGETRDYVFSVANHTVGAQNEVTMKYALSVDTPNDWPITAVILKKNGDVIGPVIDPDHWEIMGYTGEIKHDYVLRLKWDKPGTASTTPWNMTINLDAVQKNEQ